MPQKSGFFDTTADDPREYPAREFAEYFARFVGNGVFSGGTKLKVTATGNDANVKIDLGYAWINGYMYSVFDTPLTLPIAPATTQDRIDRIILRLDTSTPVRAVQAMVIQGLPNASPTPPSIIRSGDIYDLSLAQVRIKANSSIVLPENITDERLNNAVCGLVTGLVQQADTTTIFNQFQSWLNTKTAEYQQQWQDFLKGVQDEGFATTQYVDDRVLSGGYGITTNSGNAYSVIPNPRPTALVEGLRITVKVNAANTGAATINVNGLGAKSILRGNGTALISGSMKANSVYSLVYNGSAFILQGEGGEYGTATAADVLAPKTIGTENGIVTGTIVNRGAGELIVPGTANITKQAGYYSSDIIIRGEPNKIPSNIRKGVSIDNVVGTMSPGSRSLINIYPTTYAPLTSSPGTIFRALLYTFPAGAGFAYIDFYREATNDLYLTPGIVSLTKNASGNQSTLGAGFELWDQNDVAIQSFNWVQSTVYNYSEIGSSMELLVIDKISRVVKYKLRGDLQSWIAAIIPSNFDFTGPLRLMTIHRRESWEAAEYSGRMLGTLLMT